MTRGRAVRTAVLAAVLAVAGAGCGAGTQPPGGTGPAARASADPRDAAVEFAECLREHGVDVGDPDDQGTVTLGGDGDERALREAQEACKDKAPAIGVGPGGGLDAAAQEQMLRFSRCMRDHGVDMPDPGADGGIRMDVGEDGPEPGSPQFERAERACRTHLSGRPAPLGSTS